MFVGYEIDLSDLERVFGEIAEELVLKDNEPYLLAARAMFMIQTRTAKGLDFEGHAFDDYSDRYSKFRDKKGRNTSPVDLTFTGQMLAAMVPSAEGNAAVVTFSNATERRKAGWHNDGTPRMPKRRFLDLEEDGKEAFKLANMAAEFMARRI